MKNILPILLLMLAALFSSNVALAQTPTQTVRGTIIDQESEQPLIGATILLLGTDQSLGTATDADGNFELTGVPVGRQSFSVQYIGYNSITLPNVVVTAGKEVSLNISLVESIVSMNEVVITAETEKDRPLNDMAAVSARTFNLEEVTRYSGGRNDVSRLVSNFAGVGAADDSRNDIVVRGNSPSGVLWRLDGVPIPSPNHFATLGTTGGPVSALNPNMLANSDFLTSAFPAEYGNANAGVFDINFRNGNRDRLEFTAQLAAFSGLEAMVEGPLSKAKNSSFLVAYRYSFVGLATAIGIPIGTNATPNYQDLSFKVDLGNSKLGKFSVFGIGATSNIDFLGDEIDTTDIFADPNADSYVTSRFGVIGVRHNIIVGKDAYVRTVISGSTSGNTYQEDQDRDGERQNIIDLDQSSNVLAVTSYLNKKFNARLNLRAGITFEYRNSDMFYRDREFSPEWQTVWDFNGSLPLYQTFAQAQYKFNTKLTLNAGLHGQWMPFTEDVALEPRAALSWNFAPKHTLSIGYGLHNQSQPLPIRLCQEQTAPNAYELTNEELGFTRSNHFVLGYDSRIAPQWRLKSEIYYQLIDRVPVDRFSSSFSMLNAGNDFVFPQRGSLVNEGIGSNYGFELTVEKFFSQGYYMLLTGSLFNSDYEGSDGIRRSTAFNNQFIANFLAGREFKLGSLKRNALNFDMKITTSGGRSYTPVDLPASIAADREILDETKAFSERFPTYFRFDFKIGYSLNSKKRKFSQQFFVDFQNLTNRQNVFDYRYSETSQTVSTVYQSGFFPDLLWRVQF